MFILIQMFQLGPKTIETRPRDLASVISYLATNPAEEGDIAFRPANRGVLLVPQGLDPQFNQVSKQAEQSHRSKQMPFEIYFHFFAESSKESDRVPSNKPPPPKPRSILRGKERKISSSEMNQQATSNMPTSR
jgi:hypothetical protein